MSGNNKDENYSEAETARRRDAVVRRMANTPPQPKTQSRPPEKKTKAATGRVARKDHGGRER
jgi:hypothetical protein